MADVIMTTSEKVACWDWLARNALTLTFQHGPFKSQLTKVNLDGDVTKLDNLALKYSAEETR
jgi:hypothetical protein